MDNEKLKKVRKMVLSLKIFIPQNNVTKTLQFDAACLVYDACRAIRDKIPEAKKGQGELGIASFFPFWFVFAVKEST